MKHAFFLLAILLALCLTIALVFVIEEPENAHGFKHATFQQAMLQGGSGIERHATARWLGLVYGTLQIIFIVSCLLFGVPKATKAKVTLICCGGAVVSVFGLLVITDYFYVRSEAPMFLLGFPLPTAVMLYGIWGVPLIFVLFFVIRFDQWILKPEELERFETLLAEKRESQDLAE